MLFNYRDEHNDRKLASDSEGGRKECCAAVAHVELDATPRLAHSAASMLYFGTLFYVGVLLVNALAVLNEERFLARSSSYLIFCS